MISFVRASVVGVVLAAAGAPLHAQSSRFETPTFTIELPAGVATPMRVVQRREDPSSGFESYVSGGMAAGSRVMVLVNRTYMRGLPDDPVMADSAALRRLLADAPRGAVQRLMDAPTDTSAAARQLFAAALNDTSLAIRRAALQQAQVLYSRPGFIHMEGAGEEIITDERVTRRAPAKLDLDVGPYHGLADLTVARRGGIWETWLVLFVSAERTPAGDAAARRMLNSFRTRLAPPR